MADLIRPRPA